ncbi:MAG TPA: hypothetical protein VGQ42_05055 [Candidatus Dormibacteraeota bacterium]|jgi:hypothetical protein|nr:hypothetical protein [Candidatus Dormibacteraeota bacterium]
MLKWRLVAASVVGASIVLASFLLVRGTGSNGAAQLSATAPGESAPPFPQDVVDRTGPTSIDGRPCTQEPGHNDKAPDIRNISTLPTLYGRTDEIVVADAVRQVGFWEHRIGPRQQLVWSPATMTQYHVVSVIKGAPGPWIDVIDIGATSAAIPTCKSLTYLNITDPLPTTGTKYVLFVQLNPELGRIVADAGRRFPIIGGTVYTEGRVHPEAAATVVQHYTPQSLSAFTEYLATLASPRTP